MGEANDSMAKYYRGVEFTGKQLIFGDLNRVFRRYSDHLYREYVQNWFLTPVIAYGIKFNKEN